MNDLTTAARIMRRSTREERAGWLEAVADALDAERASLVDIADRETHLGATRLEGEVARTTGQLRLFAEVIREGSYLELTIDRAAPDATPPKPELRRMLRPIGSVAVFSASNFPFAFSVAGGDTASALAAGCPVVVKAHSGHPELSRATAAIVSSALRSAGAPDGAFSLIEGREAGRTLVLDPAITAVAFTGSLDGGRALIDAIAERDVPIPFFGELGSLNPVVITAGALEARGDAIRQGFVDSFTLGGGQFCTKPGVVFAPTGFSESPLLRAAVEAKPAFTLLTDRIRDAFAPIAERLATAGDATLAAGTLEASDVGIRGAVIRTTVANFMAHADVLTEECFGPLAIVVEYDDVAEVLAALPVISGSLTATVHAESDELAALQPLIESLAERAGRVLFDGWPTGVAVGWAQHHGGPWPATSTQHTSVGATAIRRFLRPVVFQNAPAALLPAELADEGLAALPHRRDGRLVLP